MILTLESPEDFQLGADWLAQREPAFAALREEFGLPEPWWRDGGYPTLVFVVLEQQVSIGSAKAAWRRLTDHVGEVSPERMVAFGEAGIREAGITRQKARTCIELASRLLDGSLDLELLVTLDDASALAALTSIKGIGPWTGEVYLLSVLRRADLFPAADRALVLAAHESGLCDNEPSIVELRERARDFAPWRSVAAWMLWHAYLQRRGRAQPPSRLDTD